MSEETYNRRVSILNKIFAGEKLDADEYAETVVIFAVHQYISQEAQSGSK